MIATQNCHRQVTPTLHISQEPLVRASCSALLLTLVASLQQPEQTSIYDMAQMWAELRNEFRKIDSMDLDDAWNALGPCRTRSRETFDCLHRDLQSIIPPSPKYTPEQVLSLSNPLVPSLYDLTEWTAKISTAQEALQVVAVIFHNEVIQKIFSCEQLRALIEDLAGIIVHREKLPCPPERRNLLCEVVLSAFSFHSLPHTDIILAIRQHIYHILHPFTLAPTLIGSPKCVEWSLRIIASLSRDPSTLPIVFDHFSFVLGQIKHRESLIRQLAAVALAGYASGRLVDPTIIDVSSKTISFLRAQDSARHIGFVPLSELAWSAIQKGRTTSGSGDNAVWAAIIISSLLVLADIQAFNFCVNDTVTDFFISAIGRFRRFSDGGDELYAGTLKVFFWVLHRWHEAKGSRSKTQRQEMFQLIVKPLPLTTKAPITFLTLEWLLDLKPTSLTSKALEVLLELCKSDDVRMLTSATQLLSNLLTRSPDVATNMDDHLHPFSLLLRSMDFDTPSLLLLTSQQSELEKNIRTCVPLPKENYVRSLTDQEIRARWEGICDMWMLLFERCLVKLDVLPDSIFESWHGLLLTSAHLTQEQSNLEPDNDHGKSIVEVFMKLLNKFDNCANPDRLFLAIRRLWKTIQSAYEESSWLKEAATSLSDALHHKQPVENARVELWCGLFVMLLGPRSLAACKDMSSAIERQVWVHIARDFTNGHLALDKNDLFDLLETPLTSKWQATEQSVSFWWNIVIWQDSEFFDRLVTHSGRWARGFVQILVKVITMDKARCLLMQILKVVSDALVEEYTSRRTSGIDLLRSSRHLLAQATAENALLLVTAMEEGWLKWIQNEDRTGFISPECYENEVLPVYIELLELLRGLPVTKENLAMITEILISVFTPEYIPPAGPKAFVLFWATTYKPRKELAPFYSKELAACLEAFHAVRTEKANSGTSFMEKQSIFHSPHRPQRTYGQSLLKSPFRHQIPVCSPSGSEWNKMLPSLQQQISLTKQSSGECSGPQANFANTTGGASSFLGTSLVVTPLHPATINPLFPGKKRPCATASSPSPPSKKQRLKPTSSDLTARSSLSQKRFSSPPPPLISPQPSPVKIPTHLRHQTPQELASTDSQHPPSQQGKWVFDGVVLTPLKTPAHLKRNKRPRSSEDSETGDDHWEQPIDLDALQALEQFSQPSANLEDNVADAGRSLPSQRPQSPPTRSLLAPIPDAAPSTLRRSGRKRTPSAKSQSTSSLASRSRPRERPKPRRTQSELVSLNHQLNSDIGTQDLAELNHNLAGLAERASKRLRERIQAKRKKGDPGDFAL